MRYGTMSSTRIIFLSSDFELERRRLWDEALPELQQHFLPYGLDIVLVDIHQGSEVDLTYDRHSFDRLLNDISESSTAEIGPFFLVSIGSDLKTTKSREG